MAINNLKGHVFYNDVHIFDNPYTYVGYHKYKDNWPEGSNFVSALAKGQRYFKIDIFVPKFAPQVYYSHTWKLFKPGTCWPKAGTQPVS